MPSMPARNRRGRPPKSPPVRPTPPNPSGSNLSGGWGEAGAKSKVPPAEVAADAAHSLEPVGVELVGRVEDDGRAFEVLAMAAEIDTGKATARAALRARAGLHAGTCVEVARVDRRADGAG